MAFKLSFDKAYGWVVLSATAIGFQCYFTGFAVPMEARKKVFSQEYMQKNFGELHKQEIGTNLPSLGYPDMGNGRYSEKLSYKDWFDFNNAMRTHQQYVEHIGIIIPFLLIGGLSTPRVAAGLGLSYFVGRALYTVGYTSKQGPSGRETGAGILNVALMGSGALSIYSALRVLRHLKF